MEKNKTALVTLTILNLMLVFSIFAENMELEIENGTLVILHSDHSWSYKTADTPELSDDTSIMLTNGQAIQIKRNYTWFYIEGNHQNSSTEKHTEESYLSSVYSAGKAQGNDLIKTKRTAMSQATKQLAKQLKATFKTQDLTIENLVQCIENEGKNVTINEQVRKGIWKIEISMSLEEDQIQRVINCALP